MQRRTWQLLVTVALAFELVVTALAVNRPEVKNRPLRSHVRPGNRVYMRAKMKPQMSAPFTKVSA